ncbi:tRNA (adenosine(37)-N6)-threonylcarbamoyltransferase complex dimerization subunit type 1 TsaB [Flexivirga endophytica]|uniref:tRNA (Adenosine(37)-N6)-threonylcarbamoyltransferase complex dimerization subunit type 1 TsaB n=1 Tax=Flexivirga endophytica TaxID=1849103 RepID=A0A916TII9_9MICO|nr:tRNA (adenosine(37)-N6)-threonylcarbamoyltransferase complex dimerization subunit type 1 TsaB [Flexivirga endophytica]GGB47009.1 tRNA (adenosine(37)-N6)-threonylcarbamoyltransferase complex dimerization subunit type 1 TsaB [Flexivirga endophytica]GHB67526.1 tRNA (adenosine(37)-N6)-threonylcarbamoyltransferase complex dimerization subunit type 1 TsaB [Flexivirga endophytica]
MLLLALDTATSAVTVALHDGDHVVAEESLVDSRRHAETLTPMISSVVAAAGKSPVDLTAIAVGVGPGPFTGLRVGLATAGTLGLALDIPVHGVCSLDALAYAVARADTPPADFVVAADARRKEVYWARYRTTGESVERTSGMPQVSRPEELPEEIRSLPAAGRGPTLYPEFFAAALSPLDVPAGALASYAVRELAAGRDLLPLQPLYLRQPDAKPATAQKSVLPR